MCFSEIKAGVDLWSYFRSIWETKKAISILLAIIFIAGLAFLYNFDVAQVKTKVTTNEIIALFFICFMVLFIWLLTRNPQRIDKNKIGIAIAIKTENKKVRLRLKNDFVSNLKNAVKKGHCHQLQVISLSEYHSQKIEDTLTARKYHQKTKAHLIFYGSCVLRRFRGKECYVLKLDVSVVHGRLPKAVSQSIGSEMRKILPPGLIFSSDDEMVGFLITSETIGYASRYIIGLGSLFSGNIRVAFDFHNGLLAEIDALENSNKNLNRDLASIKKIIPLHLTDEAILLARYSYNTKSERFLDKMGSFLEIAKRFDPKDYEAHMLRGIYYFLNNRQIDLALEEMRLARNEKDHVWQMNVAFLEAYLGNLENSHKAYKRALYGFLGNDIPMQCEGFIHGIIKQEPDKIQLYYCLGMINYFFKEDLALGKENFSKFVTGARKINKFKTSIEFAEKYIKEIEQDLKKVNNT